MHHGLCFMNISMIYTVRKLTGELSASYHNTSLGIKHCYKDAFTKMRVYLVAQVLEANVVRMFEMVLTYKAINLPFYTEQYDPIKKTCITR